MKIKLLAFLSFFSILSAVSQTVNFNIQKGYVAEGYDVVSYFDNQALKGKSEFTTTYDGATYKFSSEDNLNKFIGNPKSFVPQYGGYCAYAIAEKAKKVKIDPKTYEIRDGKLYLFYNAWGTNTLKLWLEKDVKGLQEKADKNWEAMILE
ncbi:YHS domain-containing (seleno)protein [uncultured Psychroserpens sp.]|uniref:YHS domain-containing (seleno)protein n=1 Tax=uncultured Psychroserpens sp. TaxID=255436 RepID=UPI002623B3EC|nr:YHS domain-containing (seleno)protein [uncultured Psychroserpens sp.]